MLEIDSRQRGSPPQKSGRSLSLTTRRSISFPFADKPKIDKPTSTKAKISPTIQASSEAGVDSKRGMRISANRCEKDSSLQIHSQTSVPRGQQGGR